MVSLKEKAQEEQHRYELEHEQWKRDCDALKVREQTWRAAELLRQQEAAARAEAARLEAARAEAARLEAERAEAMRAEAARVEAARAAEARRKDQQERQEREAARVRQRKHDKALIAVAAANEDAARLERWEAAQEEAKAAQLAADAQQVARSAAAAEVTAAAIAMEVAAEAAEAKAAAAAAKAAAAKAAAAEAKTAAAVEAATAEATIKASAAEEALAAGAPTEKTSTAKAATGAVGERTSAHKTPTAIAVEPPTPQPASGEPPAESSSSAHASKGDRIRVWWNEDEFYDGTVVDVDWRLDDRRDARRGKCNTRYRLRVHYDDGDVIWEDADETEFRVLPCEAQWKAAAAAAAPPASMGTQRNPVDLEPRPGARALPLREVSHEDQACYLPKYRLGLPITQTKRARLQLQKALGQSIYQPRASKHRVVFYNQPDVAWLQSHVSEARLRAALDCELNTGDGVGLVEPRAIRDSTDPAIAHPGELSFGTFAVRTLEAHALLGGPLLVYRGQLKTQDEYNKEVDADAARELEHLYTVDLARVPELTIDASHTRNAAALINDYRGRSPPAKANVRFIECYVDGRPMVIVDNPEPILADAQLLADYGEAFWREWPAVQARAASIRNAAARSVANALAATAAMVKIEK